MLSDHKNEPRCDIEEPGRNTSPAPSSNADTALAIIQRSDSRVRVTPLAGPVLPDVKKIAAGLAGSGPGSVTSGSDSIHASKRCGQPGSAASSASGITVGDPPALEPAGETAGG
jgi:hypothetical protein